MNRCKTCIHWDMSYGSAHRCQCLCAKMYDDHNGNDRDGLTGGEPAECDCITTGPDFGCIHWEKLDRR